MEFNRITEADVRSIRQIVGDGAVLEDPAAVAPYGRDETEDLAFMPEVVVIPENVEQVSALLHYCQERRIPVTPRGAGTGLSGAALPVYGGVLLSMKRFNRILDIDLDNLQATAEPGVITQHLIDAAAAQGLYYPVDPSSKGSCFLGGNVAHGSGGPRVVKYGTIRQYVLNLEVVLPGGEVIWTGANTLKYASGYDLTQLMIGSEGTLAVITKIVVRLVPLPAHQVVLLASFKTNEMACAAVSAVFRAGLTPSALEFMERRGMDWVREYNDLPLELSADQQAFLLIELDGDNMDLLYADCERLNTVLEAAGCADVLLADTAAQKEELWRIRRTMPESVKSNSVYKEEDTVVPRAALPSLISGIKEIGRTYGFDSVCYGHAGDGNLHVNIIRGNMSEAAWKEKLPAGIAEVFRLTVSLGGTISGEHGIGWVQKTYMPLRYGDIHMNLLRGIKKAFDPHGILNPGKIFDDAAGTAQQ
ncbi:FAD-binding oxidoreductase [Pedobacter yulinensis]|uniref:FAD-binding oxidoreductase n=2 Tax=Pedobacter yulinensis TaxID=2126353 RepID=A0A2T3HKG8_9SPHI|nr:FAD-binding oxidoreductase [Pedobacter yulinensis]